MLRPCIMASNGIIQGIGGVITVVGEVSTTKVSMSARPPKG